LYRQRRADYSSMRALEVWYDKIGIEEVLEAQESEEDRERMKQRIEKARERSSPEFVFPKLVEHRGAAPRIKEDRPLIFRPAAEDNPLFLQIKEAKASVLEAYAGKSLHENQRVGCRAAPHAVGERYFPGMDAGSRR
jgi:hypothetical protein